jgi:hypothetical protein
VQTLSRHHVSLDQAPERIEHMADGSHASAIVDNAIGTPSRA